MPSSGRYLRGHDVGAPAGSYQGKSFHESMARGPVKRSRSRSPYRGVSGRGDRRGRSRSRSRSVDRFERAPPARQRSPARGFHKAVLGSGRSPSPVRNQRLSPPRVEREEEEEEGMIPADD